MEQHFASLPARAIRGYHSFTRMPRAMLLERYALSLQQQGHGHAVQLWVEGQRQGVAARDGSALPLQVRQREGGRGGWITAWGGGKRNIHHAVDANAVAEAAPTVVGIACAAA